MNQCRYESYPTIHSLREELTKVRKNVSYPKGVSVRNNMLVRTGLAVVLMAGYLSAYVAFGTAGLVILALIVLLGLTHPFWLIKWRRIETGKRKDPERQTRTQPTDSSEEVHVRKF